MVEEMMLLANVTVAEHVLSHFVGCTLLRRHQVPPPRQFEPLLKAASAAHFSIDISSSKVMSEDVWNACAVCWHDSSWRSSHSFHGLCQSRSSMMDLRCLLSSAALLQMQCDGGLL